MKKNYLLVLGILFVGDMFFAGCTVEDDIEPMIQEGDHDYFTIGVGKQVEFAPGNLAEDGRSFVANQWESGGLFGWGTGNNPGNTSTDWQDYTVFYDWGDSIESGWRTLTTDEWMWVFYGRTGARDKLSMGSVNGVHGLILLPGKWTLPEGCSFTRESIGYTTNSYSVSQWQQMEAAGAVFLPATNFREGDVVFNGGDGGSYWTATPANMSWGGAYFWVFDYGLLLTGGFNQSYYGRAVRLARDVRN